MLTRAVAALFILIAGSAQAQEAVSPFSGVRWTDAPAPDVRLGETWVRLVSIEDISADSLTLLAIAEAGRDWQEYLSEDLGELLERAGWKRERPVRLRFASGGIVRDTLVEATPEARWQSRWYGVAEQWTQMSVRRASPVSSADVARSHLTVRFDGIVPGADAWRAENPFDVASAPARHLEFEMEPAVEGMWLRADQADADLATLETFMAENFSYYGPRADRFLAALDTIRAGLGEAISRRDFALQVRRAVAQFGDGHTRLSLSRNDLTLPGRRLPFRLAEAEGRILAIAPASGGFVHADYPVLTHLDGEPIEVWLAAAEAVSPATAPLRARNGALSRLSRFEYLAALRHRVSRDSVTVRLVSDDGRSSIEQSLALVDRLPSRPSRDDVEWRQRPDGVGIITLRRMARGRAFRNQLHSAMAELRETDGLVIDVRGNGGGTRDALRVLLPYVLDAPRVVNAARLRLNPATDLAPPEGYLAERSMRPLASESWTPAEREAIDAWWSTFTPHTASPDSLFSAWHAMVVTPEAAAFRYRKPVVVLMDTDTFSATDIFLGAFKGVPGVTLIGTSSGGGSGFARSVYLPESRLDVSASSMASYLPTGALYETAGVAPDIERPLTLADWRARFAGGDPQLDTAIATVRR